MIFYTYGILSVLPVALMLLLAMRCRLPNQHQRLELPYIIPEVAVLIASNPMRKHYVALSKLGHKQEVLDALIWMGVDPCDLDLHFSSVVRLASGWSSVERNCAISATSPLTTSYARQIVSRLRADDAISLVFKR